MLKNRLFTLFILVYFLSEFHPCLAKEWKRIYLASYQRSGNHWVRYLVEEASHIATSAVYIDKDPPHMKKVFPWGGYCSENGLKGDCRYPTKDDIVFIKTHFPDVETEFDNLPHELIIRIVRHPIDSFYSRYVKNPRGPLLKTVPSERVKEMVKKWKAFQNYWNKRKDVLTIRYEDILANPSVELKKICEALHYQVTDEDIARAVAKYPPQGFTLKHIDKFESEDVNLIMTSLKSLLIQFQYEAP